MLDEAAAEDCQFSNCCELADGVRQLLQAAAFAQVQAAD
jgi:hypothetical protein